MSSVENFGSDRFGLSFENPIVIPCYAIPTNRTCHTLYTHLLSGIASLYSFHFHPFGSFMMLDKAKHSVVILLACVGLMAIGLLTLSGLGRSFQTRSASSVLRMRHSPSSSTPTTTITPRPFQNCTGTAVERRALASRGDEATPQDWRDMTSCFLERRRHIHAHLFLHVSKSGGTSICEFTQQQQYQVCFAQDMQDAHCQIGPPVGTSPRWMHASPRNFQMPKWMPFDDKRTSDPTCDDMRQYTQERGIKFLMKENYLPLRNSDSDGDSGGGTACTDSFWTSMILRDPVDRILSHYNHMRRACRNENDHSVCDSAMLSTRDTHYFNLTRMKQHFHLITDNYYVRSLSEKSVFHDERNIGDDEKLLLRALTVLRSVDWIMPLEDKEALTEVLHEGLGLHGELLRSNTNHGERKDMMDQDLRRLRRWNRADYALYEEALRLHRLDMVSIGKLRQYAPEALGSSTSAGSDLDKCCGVVC